MMQLRILIRGLVVVLSLTMSSVAGAGDLDSSFGGDGKVMTAIGNRNDGANGVALQDDGKIVVAGYSNNDRRNDDFAIVRYNSDGSLDTSFDSDGKVTTAIGNSNEGANSVAIQSDGKIVAAGYSDNDNDEDFAILRYNSDGSLDTSFDGDGRVTTDFGRYERARDIAIQNDGKIVAAGNSASGRSSDFAIARYDSNGSLDTTFGSGGKVTTTVGIGLAYATSVAIQNDGKIVVAGYSFNSSGYTDFAIVRYNTDGSLDTTFDGDGIVITAISSGDDHANGVAIQDNGKIVAAGSSYNGDNDDFAVVRYNSNGSLDTSFGGGDGIVTTDFAGHSDWATSVAIQDDGKIIAVGDGSESAGHDDFAIARYNSNGSLDTTFSDEGKIMTDFGSDYNHGHSVAIQDDGKIIAVGASAKSDGYYDFAVARYLGDSVTLAPIYYLLQ